jgi:hypothetical protein
MVGKPKFKVAMTATQMQQRWRAKKRRQLLTKGDRAPLRTPKPRPEDTEFWPTPPDLRAALVRYVIPGLPSGPIWECAAGDGVLGDDIAAAGREVLMSDIDPQRRGILRHDIHNPPPPETFGMIACRGRTSASTRFSPVYCSCSTTVIYAVWCCCCGRITWGPKAGQQSSTGRRQS